ncbi:MAG TPA: LytTR family DNA-binding domain-containing protein, partial [Vicinamibacterales bacterium]
LLVDDERLARRELRRLLASHPDVSITGEAVNVDDAVARLAAGPTDLVFLDIQMPGGSGFDVLERVDRVPLVVFTTAYDEYAVRAFEVNAFDYLVKPIRPERLAAALDKVRAAIKDGPAKAGPHDKAGHYDRLALERVFVRDGDRCWIVRIADIALFEVEGNYARAYFGSNRPLIRSSLNELEARLDRSVFFRASRQHLFNLRFVESVERAPDDTYVVHLRNGSVVPVSRRQSRHLRENLSL